MDISSHRNEIAVSIVQMGGYISEEHQGEMSEDHGHGRVRRNLLVGLSAGPHIGGQVGSGMADRAPITCR